MKSLGLERGWYRGATAEQAGNKTGNFYTLSPDEAAGYAKRFKIQMYENTRSPPGHICNPTEGISRALERLLQRFLRTRITVRKARA